jgi:hypothetical protein
MKEENSMLLRDRAKRVNVSELSEHRRHELWTSTARMVAASTTAIANAGLQIKRSRLNEEEQVELLQLAVNARTRRGIEVERLNERDRSRYEQIVEKAARRPGVFQALRQERELVQLRRALEPIAREARKPPRRIDVHEPGSITLPKDVCFDAFDTDEPYLWISTLGMLAFVVSQLENGACLAPNGRVEGAGDDAALVIDKRKGFGIRFDGDEQRLTWRDDLDHLAANDMLDLEEIRGSLYIRRGARLRGMERAA